MFEEETALAASAEAKLADELLVAGAVSGGTLDAADEFAVALWVGVARHL